MIRVPSELNGAESSYAMRVDVTMGSATSLYLYCIRREVTYEHQRSVE